MKYTVHINTVLYCRYSVENKTFVTEKDFSLLQILYTILYFLALCSFEQIINYSMRTTKFCL